jgi:glycosyltransferase involved in cell wall biosynthesis
LNPPGEICFPHPPGSGGPGTFQERFSQSVEDAGWIVTIAGSACKPDLVMVVGGTRRLCWLWKMKKRGVRVVHRLDGIGWLHRRQNRGFRHFILSEFQNLVRKFIHAYFADHIIYQSSFVKAWWDRSGLRRRQDYTIIHNGVDTALFKPSGGLNKPIRLVCLEGTLDYSPYAIRLINEVRDSISPEIPFELYGRFENGASEKRLHPGIIYHGTIPRNEVPGAFQRAILLSLDIHPACPNGVIESLAAGAPVVAFDTGSLKELVHSGAGRVVPYGSDPWKLGYPDAGALIEAIGEVYNDYASFSRRARQLAVECYNIEDVMERYIGVISAMLDGF